MHRTPSTSSGTFTLALLMASIAIAFSNFAPITAVAAEPFSAILGTQAIGGKYQFTDQPALLEAAQVVEKMGATSFKFALRFDPQQPAIQSAAALVSLDPIYRKVLDMPFSDFQIWVDAKAEGAWQKGLSPPQVLAEYRNVYELAIHLLRTYSGTGKSFYLGHWEGDNMLRGDIGRAGDLQISDPVRLQGFIDWLTIRQQAADDAKRDTPHQNVNLWHYTEVNHPTISLREGRPSLANKVLPHVAVDFVSYSAYDSQTDPTLLRETLDYLESQLQPKPGIAGRRVFIGEYGFWTQKDGKLQNTPQQQNDKSLEVIRIGLEWGCPFILYWQLYNNELDADGTHRGFWMIDSLGAEQPIYKTHLRYYAWARTYAADAKAKTEAQPNSTTFRRDAVAWINRLSEPSPAP